MIKVNLTTAFFIYLGVSLFLLLFVWIYTNHRSKIRKIIPEERDLFTCEYCSYAYLASHGASISRCPQCKSLNKNNPYKTTSGK